ncbi:MAG TPA: hypothetical protein VM577_08495, partial [Anaerovoracaceae bacterium]|nr:hypothetical protein [Anaerovoracaceae bacterium]
YQLYSMSNLVHYIVVRRDLPLGVCAAMITHAAGESGALYMDPYDGRFRGATAVVLEAKNEGILKADAAYFRNNGIRHVEVHESGGPYHGQLMAIGLVPDDREILAPKLSTFQTLKVLDNVTPAP